MGVSDQVRQKPGCTATEEGLRLGFRKTSYCCISVAKTKVLNHLRGYMYRAAELHLRFRIHAKSRLSRDAAHTKLVGNERSSQRIISAQLKNRVP